MNITKTIIGIIGAIIILLLSQIVAQVFGSVFIIIKLPDFIGYIVASVLYFCLSYFGLKLFAKKYLKTNLKAFSIPKFYIKTKCAIIAVLLPTAVTVCYILFSGKLYKNNVSVISVASLGIFYLGLASAFVEEMVFRGIILNLIAKKTNTIIAIIVPSFLFATVHIIGNKFSLISILLVLFSGTIVGIMFSLIAIKTKSIWNSGIVHAVWNIIIVGGLFKVGTQIDKNSIYNYVLNTKNILLTGGDFGIESSIISIIGYSFVIIISLIELKNKKNKETLWKK